MSERPGVVPASLSFLAIYNPSLSEHDENSQDQIVYYYSKSEDGRKKRHHKDDDGDSSHCEERGDERLRQIGLAQGMVSFARNFSNGKAVDYVETEKSRIILHEIEPDWWLLASINLTRLPGSLDTLVHDQAQESQGHAEYSARELSPPTLLLQQLLRAHHILLLHQASSIANLYTRIARPKFCGILKRFWDGFIWKWNVLLNGNPATDIYDGLKLAAGGELGIGVGEEEWGSGEREVLEGFIGRTEGLVDLVVSRFGEGPSEGKSPSAGTSRDFESSKANSYLRSSVDNIRPTDGVVFSGIGALTRPSIKIISSWMEWVQRYGKDAYGVRENPSSAPRQVRKKLHLFTSSERQRHAPQESALHGSEHRQNPDKVADGPAIPPSIIAVESVRQSTISAFDAHDKSTGGKQASKIAVTETSTSGTDTLMKYLTLGVYGSSWGIPSKKPPLDERVSSLRKEVEQDSEGIDSPNANHLDRDLAGGVFLIGLQGELDESVQNENVELDAESDANDEYSHGSNNSQGRVMMRTVHVERVRGNSRHPGDQEPGVGEEVNQIYHDRLRVVVYVQKPFIFTFLFETQTDSLAIPSFYRSLHHQLGPLQRPLLASTSPRKVSHHLFEAASPKSTTSTASNQPICDLVYDPIRLTVHTTIPNIPEPGAALQDPSSSSSSSSPSPFFSTRVEALSVHSQILNTYISTRRHHSELERTCKTNRGWWVVWMRLPYSAEEREQNRDVKDVRIFQEAFLIRKASDYVAPAARKSSRRFGRDVSSASGNGNGGWGPGKLAEGIGIDARQYIESLLSLNR